MIAKMKRMSLVVMEKEREASLDKLKEAGVVHLKKKNVTSKLLGDLLDKHTKNLWLLGFLSKYQVKDDTASPEGKAPSDIQAVVQTMVSEMDELKEQMAYYNEEKRRLEAWGNLDPKDFAFLSEHGVKLFLYQIPAKIFGRIGSEAKFIVVSKDSSSVKVASLDAEIPGLRKTELPGISISAMDERLTAISRRVGEIETEFAKLAQHIKTIEDEDSDLLEEIEYETAKEGMEILEDAPPELTISWLSGFVPEDKIETVKNIAVENSWTLAWSDPSPNDKDAPPTLLKNKPAVRIIEPLFSMLGTLPGYWEYDISFSYLVFFCLFFSMILGDAVYGIILLVMGLVVGILTKKKSGQFADIAKLLIVLSLCTIIWGGLTGSWFAVPAEKLPPFLQTLIVKPFNNVGPLSEFPVFMQKLFKLPDSVPADTFKTQWSLQFLCFTVGVIQMAWARIKNIFRLLPSLTAFAQAGWLIVLIAIYFLVLFILLNMALPPFVLPLIITGVALNFIFSEQKGGNFLKNVGKAFANFFPIILKTIGCFGDIISYIRLFAVGMAGGMIVQTVNTMAIPESFGSFGVGFVLRILVMVLILGFGHSLNLAINALSVIVHGLRLNLLEYAGNHLEIGWSGYKYTPFAFKRKK